MTTTVTGPRSRYISVDSLPTGGARFSLKPAGYKAIRRLSVEGRDLISIAAALGISRDAFLRLRKDDPQAQEAIDQGRAALGDELTDILLQQFRKGVTVAGIFLAKSRCGWREGEAMQGGTVNNTQININLPTPMAREEYMRLVTGQPVEPGEEPADD